MLFHSKKEIKKTSEAMIRYCENDTVCHHTVLLRDLADDQCNFHVHFVYVVMFVS